MSDSALTDVADETDVPGMIPNTWVRFIDDLWGYVADAETDDDATIDSDAAVIDDVADCDDRYLDGHSDFWC